MLVDYREVYRLLLSSIGVPFKQRPGEIHREVSDVLQQLVFQYFNRWDATRIIQVDSNATCCLASYDYSVDYAIHAETVTQASMMIMAITARVLPGFRCYDQQDCAHIRNISMRGAATAHVEIDYDAYQRFIIDPYRDAQGADLLHPAAA